MSKRERQGLLWILAASTGFAFIPTIVKLIYAHSSFQPPDLALWRFLLAVPLMWLLILLRDRGKAKADSRDSRPVSIRSSLLMGVLFAVAALAAFVALQRLPGSTYVVLFFTYPALVVLLSMIMGDKVGSRALLAMLMALIGVALTVPDFAAINPGDWIGVGLALFNALIVALYYLMARTALAGVQDVSRASSYIMSGTLLILLLMLPWRGLQLPQNIETVFGIVAVASLGTVLPVFATNLAIQRIGPARASLASTIEPVIAMFVAMALLGEVIAGPQWLGAALIVGSVVILQLRPRNKVNLNLAHEAG